jgi:hypothetical protein
MAHFAKLDENNNVLEVVVVNNNALNSNSEEASGIEFLTDWSGGYANWKQTSYNGSFRFNFASIGGTYNQELDAFIGPKQYESWILDETTCLWKPPIEYPNDGNNYQWFEEENNWIQTNE